MSGLDLFAWAVLIVVVAGTIAVICMMGWLPGHIAHVRGHPRYVEEGQSVEMTFKFLPGRIVTGKVEAVLQAVASVQTRRSWTANAPPVVSAAPFVARLTVDKPKVVMHLRAGSASTAAVFTEHVKVSHIIRRVLLRQQAILNYVLPF